jgi:hypothetical protein
MSFMQPTAYETDYLLVDGPSGTDVIPCDVADFTPTPEMRHDAEVTESDPAGSWVRVEYPDGPFLVPPELADYCENRKAYSIERCHGWVGRMSAPGYLDCTDWETGDTEEAVVSQLKEHHGCSECGEFEDDCECGKESNEDE